MLLLKAQSERKTSRVNKTKKSNHTYHNKITAASTAIKSSKQGKNETRKTYSSEFYSCYFAEILLKAY